MCGGGAPQDRSRPLHQFVNAVRLGDVVVGSDLEADNRVELGRLGSHHDYRHRRVGPDRPGDVDSRQAGEHHIEKNKVGLGSAANRSSASTPVALDGYAEKPSLSRFTVSVSTKDS